MAEPRHAYVEDYNSDDGDLHDGISIRKSPGPANVAAKRSHHSELGGDKSPVLDKAAQSDLHSDSGYSSHTAATMSSADSAPSANVNSPRVPTVEPAAYPPPPVLAQNAQRRRYTATENIQHSDSHPQTRIDPRAQGSPRRPAPQRISSQSSKASKPPRERRSNSGECTVQGCTECPPSTRPRGHTEGERERVRERSDRPARPKLEPSRDSAINMNPYPQYDYDQVSHHSEPPPVIRAPSYRQPTNYTQGPAVVQPAQSTRRRAPSNARTRPVSYHGGDPSQSFFPTSMDNRGHGPPPSMSQHYALQHQNPQMPPYSYGATPPNGNGFFPSHPMGPTYDVPGPRPTMHSRTSSNNYRARGPAPSQYGQPLVTQQDPNLPSARFPSQQQQQIQQHMQQQLQQQHLQQQQQQQLVSTKWAEGSEYATSESEEEPEQRKPRAIMGPPKTKPSKERRQSMSRRSHKPQVYHADPMSQSMVLPERPRESRSRTTTSIPRALSTSRPRLQKQSQSAYATPQADVMIEKARRRKSVVYQPPQPDFEPEERRRRKISLQDNNVESRRKSKMYDDDEYDFEEQRRNNVYRKEYDAPNKRQSKIYQDDSYQEDAIIPQHPQHRRKTDADTHGRRQPNMDTLDNLADDVEAYQRRMRGDDVPMNDRIHQAAIRSSHIPSGPSHADSGSDKHTRMSQSARTTVTNTNNGEIRLKIDATAPLSLQFNGDMEGRTLHLHPAEDGMAELVIGNANGSETAYQSERGSIMGTNGVRKALPPANQSRRDAEEMSMRSSQTSRSRRERIHEFDPRDFDRAPTPRTRTLGRRRNYDDE